MKWRFLVASYLLVTLAVQYGVEAASSGRTLAGELRKKKRPETPAPSLGLAAAAAAINSGPVCLFIHGAGMTYRYEVTNTLSDYWGDSVVAAVRPYCVAKFVKYETFNRGWDNLEALGELCTAITATKPVAIIAHSMGNLFLATLRLKAEELCSSGKPYITTAKWIGLQAPFKGSVIADACGIVCKDQDNHPFGTITRKLLRSDLFCGCPNSQEPKGSTNTLRSDYVSKTVKVTFQDIAEEAKKVDFLLCGNAVESAGPWSGFAAQAGLNTITNVAQWGINLGDDATTSDKKPFSGVDGMVPFRGSCAGNNDPDSFTQDPTSKRYVGHMDHASGTLRYGDHDDDIKRKPLTFVLNALKAIFKK